MLFEQKRKYRMRSAMLECLLKLRLTEDADEKLRQLKNQQKKVRMLPDPVSRLVLAVWLLSAALQCTLTQRVSPVVVKGEKTENKGQGRGGASDRR